MRRARRPGAPLKVCLLPVPWSRLPEKDGGYFASGRGTFHGWKVPKDPRAVVLTKSAALRTPRCGHPSLRSLARPLPTTTTTLGRGWVPGGSAPYDFQTQSARLEKGLNLFGAGVNLGPLRPPPAAARAGQIRWPFFSHIAPLVCLAFSAPLGVLSIFRRARCPHRAADGGYFAPGRGTFQGWKVPKDPRGCGPEPGAHVWKTV